MSAESQRADPLIGQVLAGRYHVLHRIGEGAMGTVYKARHVKVGRLFAVKVLHSRLLIDPKVQQRFDREAELAGRLHHANVVGVVDIGEVNGMRYMVMDFAEGPDLAQLLAEAPMPRERVINLTRQMLEGLFHAHEQGLIHRDFKPENVIVEVDNHGEELPRIVDFGIAILRDGGDSIDGESRLTTNGLVLGTPHYMAPEQAVADPIDHRIDLFALGIVIYEMLSGRLPFDGTGAEVARANLLLDPPRISQRVPYLEVDPLLEAFARRMLEKNREDRPATAKAARELLDLIDRDPDRAALALNAARTDRTTIPIAPRDATEPPPADPPPTRRMRPSPSDSPEQTPGALPVRGAPLPPPTHSTEAIGKPRWPYAVAGALLGGVGLLAAVVVGSSGAEVVPPARAVASAATAPQDDSPPIAPEPPPPTPPTSTDPAPSAPPAGEPGPSVRAAEDTRGKRASSRKSDGKPSKHRVAADPSDETHSAETSGDRQIRAGEDRLPAAPPDNATDDATSAKPIAVKPAPERKSEPKPLPVRPTRIADVTPKALSALYYSVPNALQDLPEATSQPLWERWKRLNVQALMLGPQAERDDAAIKLYDILDEVRDAR